MTRIVMNYRLIRRLFRDLGTAVELVAYRPVRCTSWLACGSCTALVSLRLFELIASSHM